MAKRVKGLAKYLAKYVVSPPISVRRIMSYDGQRVKYWYNDHKSGRRKEEEVDVFTFIGRMVQPYITQRDAANTLLGASCNKDI